MIKTKYKNYILTAARSYSEIEAEQVIKLLDKEPTKQLGVLSGRHGVIFSSLQEEGNVVIKGYRRGGLLQHLISQQYLSLGNSRAEEEFSFLETVRGLECKAPRPIVSIKQPNILTLNVTHKAWLIMEAIQGQRTLADISESEPQLVYDLLPIIGKDIVTLIENKIFHVDLHPGNVLVDSNGKPYIIDFDKACLFTGTKSALRDKYLCRWRRAVIKHSLPEVLSELMSVEIRRKFT